MASAEGRLLTGDIASASRPNSHPASRAPIWGSLSSQEGYRSPHRLTGYPWPTGVATPFGNPRGFSRTQTSERRPTCSSETTKPSEVHPEVSADGSLCCFSASGSMRRRGSRPESPRGRPSFTSLAMPESPLLRPLPATIAVAAGLLGASRAMPHRPEDRRGPGFAKTSCRWKRDTTCCRSGCAISHRPGHIRTLCLRG